MANVQEISDQVLQFLAGDMSLDSFEDWSAEYSWNVHLRANEEIQALAYKIRGILNAHENDEDERVLREELATAIFPFQNTENHYGIDDPSKFTQSNVDVNTAIATP
jgi:hypothetical protein